MLFSMNLERALRWAAECHGGQTRRCGAVPYFEHVVGVALILDRLGFAEDVVVAGLLHDVVEDTEATLDDVRARFGPIVADLVAHGTEVKRDAQGLKRPWVDRKRDHLAALADAPAPARALVLADKLHNLVSRSCDLREGRPVWSLFHADRDQVVAYYRAAVDVCGWGGPQLEALAADCRRVLAEIESLHGPADSPREAGPSDP